MAERSRVSIKQIAEALNLSQGTVSFVMNGRGDEMRISRKTQQMIMDTAARMGYSEKKRRHKKGGAVGGEKTVFTVFIPYLPGDTANPYNRIMNGLNEERKRSKMSVEFLVCPYECGRLRESFHYINADFCSGAIVTGLLESDLNDMLESDFDVPVVIFNHINEKYASVYVDDYRAGYQVAQLFAERGHKRVGMVMYGNRNKAISLRTTGFLDGCKNAGLDVEGNIWECELSKNGGIKAAEEILKAEKLPEAIFAIIDDIAMGLLQEMEKNGVRIPEQMEVISYGDNIWNEMLSPPLSTIRLPVEDMCGSCLQMLWEMKQTGRKDSFSKIHALELVIRKSCGDFNPSGTGTGSQTGEQAYPEKKSGRLI